MLKSLIYLQEELASHESMTGLTSAMSAHVSAYWAVARQKLKAACAVEQEKLAQEIMIEAETAFPELEAFTNCKLELAELLKAKSGEATMKILLTKMQEVWVAIEKGEYTEELSEEALQALGEAHGLEMPETDKVEFLLQMNEVADKIPIH